MEILVLEEIQKEIRHSDSLKRELENLVRYVRGAITYADICIARSRVGKIRDTSMWKWKRGNISERALFFISHSPERRVPYVIVHHVCDHVEYERLIDDSAALERGTGERRRRADVVDFVSGLDRTQNLVPRIPDRYIGLRERLSLPRPVQEGLVVTESAEWIEMTLLPLIETAASDEDCRQRLEQLIDRLFDIGTIHEGMVSDDTTVEVISEGMRISHPAESRPITWRRRYGVNADDIDVERQIAIYRSANASVDPFLILDREQDEVLGEFETSHKPLPALLDGPGGSGKTALLQAIAKGVLGDLNRYSPSTRVRVVTLSDALTRNMQSALENYLHLVDGSDRQTAQQISRDVCRTFDDYLREFLDDETGHGLSDDGKRVRWSSFHEWFSSIPPSRRAGLGVHEAWCAFRVLVLGDTDDRSDPDIRQGREEMKRHLIDWFDSLPDSRRHRIDRDVFVKTLDFLGAYHEWKKINGYWDEADLVGAALRSLEDEGRSRRVDLLIVDEAQDLTPDMIRFITRSSAAFGYDLRPDDTSVVSLPLIFAADDLQTVNPSGFSWKSFETIFHVETEMLMGDSPIKPVMHRLETNFRMRERVCVVANALRDWIDPSRHSDSLPLRHGGFSGPAGEFGHVPANARRLLDIAARIIVPPGFDVVGGANPGEKFLREMYSVTADKLGTRQVRVLLDRLITANDAKGQEFATAVVFGFGSFVREMGPGLGEMYARQVTYVAASRARDTTVWFEASEDDEQWFWYGDDPRSPRRLFHDVSSLDKYTLDEMKQSDSVVVAEANRLLRSVLSDRDSDRPSLVAKCRTASTRFFQVEDLGMAEFADAVGDFLERKTTHVSLDDVPASYLDDVAELMIENSAWRSFEDVTPVTTSRSVCTGVLVAEFRRPNRDFDDFVSSTKTLVDSGVSAKQDLQARVAVELSEVASVVVAELEQRMLSGDHESGRRLRESDLVFFQSFDPAEGVYLRCLVEIMGGDRRAALTRIFDLPPELEGKKEKLLAGLLRGDTGFTWIPDSLVTDLGLNRARSGGDVMDRWETICNSLAGNPDVSKETLRRALKAPESVSEKAFLRVAAERIDDLVLELQVDGW